MSSNHISGNLQAYLQNNRCTWQFFAALVIIAKTKADNYFLGVINAIPQIFSFLPSGWDCYSWFPCSWLGLGYNFWTEVKCIPLRPGHLIANVGPSRAFPLPPQWLEMFEMETPPSAWVRYEKIWSWAPGQTTVDICMSEKLTPFVNSKRQLLCREFAEIMAESWKEAFQGMESRNGLSRYHLNNSYCFR